MITAAKHLTIRIKPSTKTRLDAMAQATRRSKSAMTEEALEQYLEVNEWQMKGIQDAVAEADRADAQWIEHDDIMAKWSARVAG
jgi:predicted transcriptional regulator